MGKRLMFMTFGSRGDAQPFLALAAYLQKQGHTVIATVNEENVEFFGKMGVEARAVHFNMKKFLTEDAKMRKAMSTGSTHTLNDAIVTKVLGTYEDSFDAIWAVAEEFKPDIVLPGLAFEYYAAEVISQLFEIPVINCHLSLQATLVPTTQIATDIGEPFKHFGAGVFCLMVLRFMAYKQMAKIVRKKLGSRVEGLNLWADVMQHMVDEWMAPAAIALIQNSTAVRPIPTDYPPSYTAKAHVTGYWVVTKDIQEQQSEKGDHHWGGTAVDSLKKFIDASEKPPVYLGWGSMVAVSPEHMATLAVAALKVAGMRGIVLGGNAKLAVDMIKDRELLEYAAASVLFVDSAPHEWLFPQCSVTVHHGGMGTTAAAFRSGVPTIVTPTIYDQFDNAEMVQGSGAGLAMPAFQKVTHQSLGEAIKKATADETMKSRAKQLGAALQAEDGLANAAKALGDFVKDELDTGKWAASYAQHLDRRRQPKKWFWQWMARMSSSRPFG